MKKSLRFKILERYSFTCQYCGKKPPDVILHVDHIVSKKDGGGDEEENLISSCSDCNLGKSRRSVNKAKLKGSSYKKDIKTLEEKREQLEAYYQFLKKKKDMEFEEVNIFQRHWNDCSNDEYSLSDSGMRSIKTLSTKYDTEMIFEAMEICWANDRVPIDGKFKYMCGVLKNIKLKKENPEEAERIKTCQSVVAFIRSKFNYCNQGIVWSYFDRYTTDHILEVARKSKNWTAFKSFLEEDGE